MSGASTRPAATERLAWTAAIIVGASLPHWLETPPWIPALLVACVGWRFAAALAAWPLPGRGIRIVLALGAFSAVLARFGTINGVTAGSALLIVMIALKFLETHTQRDHVVLMIIAYFLAFASLLYQSSLLAGAWLAAFVWLATIGLVQLGRAGELLGTWPTAKLAGRLLLKSLPIMLILFLLFPRLPGPLWALPGDDGAGTTGLSDSMSPGDITELGRSDEVAFRVEFFGEPPRQQDLYWRGPVLAAFNGRTWTRGRSRGDGGGGRDIGSGRRDLGSSGYRDLGSGGDRGRGSRDLGGANRRDAADTLEHVGERADYRVTLEPGNDGRAFAIDMPASWDGGRHRIVMTGDYALRLLTSEARSERVAYEITSYSRYRALEPLTPAERAYYTRLPAGYNPRTRELVGGWRAAGLAADDVIRRALETFREREFVYTLSPPALGRHTADEFLFETRAGFCEHYASAFTIMMRAAGIPARVVTGYQGGERNRLGDYYIVRQADAHAWAEVWLDDRGWIRVDPTAAVASERITLGAGGSGTGAGLDRGAGLGFDLGRELALAWDAVNMHWDRWVLGYGPRLQRALLELAGFERPGARHLVMLAVAALAAVAVAFGFGSMRTRRPRRRADTAARALERFVAKLERADVEPRAPSEAPTAYAERAKRRLPGAAFEIDAIVRAYLRARYEPRAGAGAAERLQRAVRSFRPR